MSPVKNQASPAQRAVETKIVSHALGKAEIPLHPQRIVVLDSSFILDPLLALSINPVGVASCSYCISSDTLSEFITNVPNVGHWEQPSLEKILSLKPDLILGHVWQKESHPRLSEIAPTVMIDTDSEFDFKQIFKYLAEILDKRDRVEKILADYDGHVQRFRQKFGEKLKTKTVSIINLYGSEISIYGIDLNPYSQVMSDAGVQFIPAYRDMKGYLGISIETLPDWDADILFMVILLESDTKNLESLSFLQQPIWPALKAVQNQQVYALSWANAVVGPITANQFIDQLYGYFSMDTSSTNSD
ncbi:MAG: iron-siderophore ABC transporter substrate-binding protein [Leptolyngbyaceae cyanobacterium SM2_5_2]|nr:iron-siderophore ABC transporter substrate-binding protein [Leptolyngbyaceae cyanobacterium SM2_5_2]